MNYGNITLFVVRFQANLGLLDRAGPRAAFPQATTPGDHVLTYTDGDPLAGLVDEGGRPRITSLGFSLFTRRY